MGILTLAASPLLLLHPPVLIWLLVGVATHLVLDTCNVMGVPLFWPARLEAVMVHNRAWRVPYGSPREFTWLGCIALAAISLVPLSLDGFGPWFHRAMGTPRGAIEDYLLWRNDWEVWAELRGHNLLTDEDVNGRFRIIDVLGKDTLLIEDGAGRAYSVGRENSANILSSSVKAWRGERITSSTYRLDLSGRLVSDLMHALPKGARSVHINAALSIKGETDLSPVVGYFERISRSGRSYELRAATPSDLTPLAHLVIESGSAVIRAEYSPGAEAQETLSSAIPAFTSHLLRIPDLPSLAGLVVNLGDHVEQGELIARYVDDAALNANAEEVAAAQERIPDLERTIELEREAHTTKLDTLRLSATDARERLERVRYLVERDAAPRAQLIEAEAALRQAEQAILLETTAWTGRLDNLQGQIRQARLVISRAERSQAAEIERQWVRAPVTGVISDIKLTSVSTKGVTLEVILLERKNAPDDGL
jgi:hypothetical protein